HRHGGRVLAVGCEVPLLDASARADPLIGGVDELRKVEVRHDARRRVEPPPRDDRVLRHYLDRVGRAADLPAWREQLAHVPVERLEQVVRVEYLVEGDGWAAWPA